MIPKKSFGQNFLHNQSILSFISNDLEQGETALEIGGGTGNLTSKLLERHPKRLFVIELENEAFRTLEQKFSGYKNVELFKGDFLKLGPFKVDKIFGNVPYYISSDIVFRLKDWDFKKAYLMLQKEFAEKMVAHPRESNYGRLSVTSQLSFKMKLLKIVKKTSFYPIPKVDSAIIELQNIGFSMNKEQEDLIRKMFSIKNRKLRHSLGDMLKGNPLENKRPRELTLDEVKEIINLK